MFMFSNDQFLYPFMLILLLSSCVSACYIPGAKVSTYGGLPRSLQYRGEAERAQVSFYLASVAE